MPKSDRISHVEEISKDLHSQIEEKEETIEQLRKERDAFEAAVHMARGRIIQMRNEDVDANQVLVYIEGVLDNVINRVFVKE